MASPETGAPRPKVVWTDVTGVVLVDKPLELSSNGALQGVRRLYRARKAGHAGTLDPLATGLLVVCFGEATKFSGYLLESHKRYIGAIQLGTRTATGDVEGEVVETAPVPESLVDLAPAERAFTGTIRQTPPIYSALKVQGQPLYKLARKGQEVEIAEREVVIHRLMLVWEAPDRIAFEVECGSGTYIRTLGEDIARFLGSAGHLVRLRRTGSGPFDVSEARTPEQLGTMGEEERAARLLPPGCLPYRLPVLNLPEGPARDLGFGRTAEVNARVSAGRYRVFGPQERFLGVGESDGTGHLRPVRLMSGGDGGGAERDGEE